MISQMHRRVIFTARDVKIDRRIMELESIRRSAGHGVLWLWLYEGLYYDPDSPDELDL